MPPSSLGEDGLFVLAILKRPHKCNHTVHTLCAWLLFLKEVKFIHVILCHDSQPFCHHYVEFHYRDKCTESILLLLGWFQF